LFLGISGLYSIAVFEMHQPLLWIKVFADPNKKRRSQHNEGKVAIVAISASAFQIPDTVLLLMRLHVVLTTFSSALRQPKTVYSSIIPHFLTNTYPFHIIVSSSILKPRRVKMR
jgi:hypothetical protein